MIPGCRSDSGSPGFRRPFGSASAVTSRRARSGNFEKFIFRRRRNVGGARPTVRRPAMNAESIARELGSAQSRTDGWWAHVSVASRRYASLSFAERNGPMAAACGLMHRRLQAGRSIAELRRAGPLAQWRASEQQTHGSANAEKIPIIPVPPDAPPMTFKHPKYGTPSQVWPYHFAGGDLAGYIARFDFIKDGSPKRTTCRSPTVSSTTASAAGARRVSPRRGRCIAFRSYWPDPTHRSSSSKARKRATRRRRCFPATSSRRRSTVPNHRRRPTGRPSKAAR